MTFDQFIAEEKQRDPEFRREWEEGEPEFQIISTVVGARSRLGWTQKELAKRMGTDQPTISRAETTGRVTPEFVTRFAGAVGGDVTMSVKVPGRPRITFQLIPLPPAALPAGTLDPSQPRQRRAAARKRVTVRLGFPRHKHTLVPSGTSSSPDPIRDAADKGAPAASH